MIDTESPIVTVPVGEPSIGALKEALESAQREDPFTRVVIIADHPDAASAVRHLLGASGLLNVTVQTGRRLASELAEPLLRTPSGDDARGYRPLTRLLELQAVRKAAEDVVTQHGFQPAGRRRMVGSLAAAFRQMQERSSDGEDPEAGQDSMNRIAEELLGQFLGLVHDMGCYTASELPYKAAEALAGRSQEGRSVPHVIHYLPRRLSEGDLQLVQALAERDRCRLVVGLTGDEQSDQPVHELLDRMEHSVAGDPTSSDPLKRAADDRRLSVLSAPDPAEEVRTVIRSIASGEAPFHRTAVIYRQDNPYATLLRQELDAAGIPYSGAEYRSLATTPSGLLLLGIVDLALVVDSEGAIDRERLIELMTSAAIMDSSQDGDGSRDARVVPASQWATLSREARADGSLQQWHRRLEAYLNHQEAIALDRDGRVPGRLRGLRREVTALLAFLAGLAEALGTLGSGTWRGAGIQLRSLLERYGPEGAGESPEDHLRIEEMLESLSSLDEWGETLSPQALREVIHEGLQSPVSDRGRPVGAGVYLGPPAGVVGAEYETVYVLGMVEKQFPPRPGTNPWIGGNLSSARHEMALERYDFLGAISSAERAVLCWPVATADRTAAYPSRWLIEAANLLHAGSEEGDRLTYETIAENPEDKPWLTVIPSRESGLRQLEASTMEPADISDYNLMHLVLGPGTRLDQHPAVVSDERTLRALEARNARFSSELSAWDGCVGSEDGRVADIGGRENPISPSALESWAACPYRYFLGRVLGLSSPTEIDEAEISNLERGLLVHRILERFVAEDGRTEEDLLNVAEEEFESAAARGVTGYHLLWDIEKQKILDALLKFFVKEAQWLGEAQTHSRAEVDFGQGTDAGEVVVSVEELGEVSFRGKMDRMDVLGDEVRVRDFKTGKPEPYFDGIQGRQAGRTVANGQALQLPVYLEAAQSLFPGKQITASYCFPLAENNTHDVAPYTAQDREQFHTTLGVIVGMARKGIFPATPEQTDDEWGGNCRYCDFKRLCPARRRQFWERKGRLDPTLQPFNNLQGPAAMMDEDNDQ